MREITVIIDLERKLILYTAIVILAVGVGPFSTYEAMPFWERLIFWSLDAYLCMAIITLFVSVAAGSKILRSLPMLLRIFIGALIGAVPCAGLITFLFEAMAPATEIPTPYPQLVFEVAVFSTILLLTEFVVWPAVFGAQPQDDEGAIATEAGTTPLSDETTDDAPLLANRFFERLPPQHQTSRIVSISMQDHYAEVTTTQGVTSLLIRLSDAEDLLQTYPGSRIHRSHWAASEYAETISKKGRGHELALSDGRTLPVSDKYLSDAKRLLDKD